MSKEAFNKSDFPTMTTRVLNFFDPWDIVITGLDTDDGTEHPLYDERIRLPLEESTILYTMVNGIDEPIIVTKEDGKPRAVAGVQRTRYAREASRRLEAQGEPRVKVPAFYKTGDDGRLTSMMVATNEHRKNDDIITKAAKAARLHSRGYTPTEVGLSFRVGAGAIRDWLKIDTVAPQLKEALREGACTQTQVLDLADKPTAEQHAAGLAYLAAAEDPKPRAPKEPAPERVRRKRRSEATLKRATVDGSEARKAVAAWMLEPTAPVDVLLSREDLPEVIREMAWALGEETA